MSPPVVAASNDELMQVVSLCPQHGAIYRGADVRRFIDWFAALPIGVLRHGPR